MGFRQLYSGNNSWDNYIMRYCDQVMLAGFSRPHCIARSMFFARTQQLHDCSSKPTLLSMGKTKLRVYAKQNPTTKPCLHRGCSWYFFPIFWLSPEAMGFLTNHPVFTAVHLPVEVPIFWRSDTDTDCSISQRKSHFGGEKNQFFGGCNLSSLQILTPWWFLHWENRPKRPSGGFQSQGTLIAGWLIYVDMEKTWKNDLQMDDEQGYPPFFGETSISWDFT